MSERSAIKSNDAGPSGPDGATAPRAFGAKPSERSERPATEGKDIESERPALEGI